MKRYHILSCIVLATTLLLTACDKDFADINTDPNRPQSENFDPNFLLPTALYDYASQTGGYSGAVLFQVMWVQLMASTSSIADYYSNGDKYVRSSSTESYIGNIWTLCYQSASRAYEMERLGIQRGNSNLEAVGKLIQIMSISFVSDVYGDVPYSNGLQGLEGNTKAAYDKQETLYPNMLKDLETALANLDDDGDALTNDTLYGGDLSKWRKLGYSLMLKLAMRLVNVDETMAKTYVEKALAGGVFNSSNDEAVLVTDEANNYTNATANAFNVEADIREVRWSNIFIDYLKATNDPRLEIVAEIPPEGLKANKSINSGNSDPSIQQGMPNGYDLTGSDTDIQKEPNYPGATGTSDDEAILGNYSRPTNIYRNRNAPFFILTYSEVEFLLAEAAVRGYNGVSGSPETHFENAIKGAITSLIKFDTKNIQIDDDAISAFIAQNPLDTSDTESSLKMINEQFWASVGMLGNYVECWNNWKRTGYPELTPVNYAGNFSSGQIPQREPYPNFESTLNKENYAAAVKGIGGSDNWVTKVWWAK